MTHTTADFGENTYKHWVLFSLAWAEERGLAPLPKQSLLDEMGRGLFNMDTYSTTLSQLRQAGLVQATPTQGSNKLSYSLSVAGKDVLEEYGAPTELPGRGNQTLNRELTLPAAVSTRPTVPDKLRVDASWPDGGHLFREDPQTGEIHPLCEANWSAPVHGTGTQTVTPADIDQKADEGINLCKYCRSRPVYHDWREQMGEQSGRDERERDKTDEPKTRWDRYQEWIDNHDFGESNENPDANLSEEQVLVAKGYTGRRSPRKLHAYRRGEDDDGNKQSYFVSLCGQATGIEHPDALETAVARSFLVRSDSCQTCRRLIRKSKKTDSFPSRANSVEYDPFGVFAEESDDTAVSDTAGTAKGVEGTPSQSDSVETATADAEEGHVCPSCGDSFETSKGLTLHWANSRSDCEYPVPDETERSLLTALWLVGGHIDGRGTPTLRKTTVHREPLEWINDHLGIWQGSIDEAGSPESQKAAVESGFGYVDADSNLQYRLTTRTCPWLDTLTDLRVSDVELTPIMGHILYSFRGMLIDKSVIAFRHRDGVGLQTCLEQAGFDVRNVEAPPEGKNQYRVTLSASSSREFAEWIGSEPLPGFENKEMEFRESHAHKEGSRKTESETPDAESSKGEVIGTISLEPEWDWVGVQLYKMGMDQLARKAFKKQFSPAEIYGAGGIQEIIYNASRSGEFNLDMGSPFEGAITTVEQPVDDGTVRQVRRELGLDVNGNGGDGNGGSATA